jgi:phosphatidylserine decarboxylase
VKIDRDGYPFVLAGAVPALVALARGRRWWAGAFGVVALALGAFFRDPDRRPDRAPLPDDVVIAPADAKVMYAGTGQEGVAPQGDWLQVSMFLSVADVHVNRCPYGGTVTDVTYRPGRFLAAFKADSAHLNERSEITVSRTVAGEPRVVVFRQVVGVLARRVVTRVAPGDRVATGERIGLMKFGSRMDVFLPPVAVLAVSTGQRVVAGETVIARFDDEGHP